MAIKIGSVWKHNNGNIYKVLLLANTESKRDEYPITVVYRGSNGFIWAKTQDNFLAKMTEVLDV